MLLLQVLSDAKGDKVKGLEFDLLINRFWVENVSDFDHVLLQKAYDVRRSQFSFYHLLRPLDPLKTFAVVALEVNVKRKIAPSEDKCIKELVIYWLLEFSGVRDGGLWG